MSDEMNKEELKEFILQAWEKWKREPNVAKPEAAPKKTFGQWLINKIDTKLPMDSNSLKLAFAVQLQSQSQKCLKGISVSDIVNWINQKEAHDAFHKATAQLDEEVTVLITPHLSTLFKKRQRLLIKDDYGFTDDKKWQDELDYFLNRAIIPQLTQTMRDHLELSIILYRVANNPTIQEVNDKIVLSGIINDLIKIHINNTLDNHVAVIPDENMDVSLLDPIEYEHFCADILKANGWNVQVTQASGDQGIDVLAEREGFLLAIQCKKYSSPVGNKAVQEVYSGGTFYSANAFAVVSPVEYTQSARELANSLGVHLFHHDDLATLTITDKENSDDKF